MKQPESNQSKARHVNEPLSSENNQDKRSSLLTRQNSTRHLQYTKEQKPQNETDIKTRKHRKS